MTALLLHSRDEIDPIDFQEAMRPGRSCLWSFGIARTRQCGPQSGMSPLAPR